MPQPQQSIEHAIIWRMQLVYNSSLLGAGVVSSSTVLMAQGASSKSLRSSYASLHKGSLQ